MRGSKAFLALAFISCISCGHRLPPPDAVARIDREELVRAADFEDYLKGSAGEGSSELSSDVLSRLLDQFLDERLLRRLAVERGLIGADATGREAVAALLRQAEEAAGPVLDGDIATHYAAHRDEFSRPERLRLRQILTADRATAERARAEILAGAEFSAVARRLSRDARARRGGFQGELGREDLPPRFAEILFQLEPGAVSTVLDAPYGHHVFQVAAHLPARRLTLAEVENEIRATLERERADGALATMVREARRRYTLEVYASNVPFEYRAQGEPEPR